MKKPWYKRIETIAAFIVVIGAAFGYITQFSTWAQDTRARTIIERRQPYFIKDHAPLYDSLAEIKKAQEAFCKREKEKDTTIEIMFYLMQEMASPDERIRAENKRTIAHQCRVIR